MKYLMVHPKYVVMPILMIFFAFTGVIVSLYYEATAKYYYFFIVFLFIFIPATSINYVLKEYTGKIKKYFLLRMVITSLGALVLVILYFTSIWKYTLFVFCIIGTLFFCIDYIKQAKLAWLTLFKTRTVLLRNNAKNLDEALKTKCSRSVVYECMIRHPCTKTRFRILLRIKRLGVKWYHCFPLNMTPLWMVIYTFILKRKQKK